MTQGKIISIIQVWKNVMMYTKTEVCMDTEEHIRAAWSYIHMPRNYEKYDANDVKTIKERIIKAWKEKINPQGPPEAEK